MKINLSVLIGCVVCIVLAVGVGVLNRAEESGDAWRPSSVYSHVGSSSSSVVSSGSSASSGVAVPVRGGRSMISSSRRVSSPVSSYAPAYYAPSGPANGQYPISGTPSNIQSPIANRQGLYTTSSATAKSFGSGNAVSGVSMSGGSVRATNNQSLVSNIQSPIANIQSPIANAQLPTMPKYQGIGNTTISDPRGLGGRFNAPPGLGGDDDDYGSGYESWLEWMCRHGWRFGSEIGDNSWHFNSDESYSAFLVWYKSVYGVDYDPNNLVTPPEFTYEEWLKWITGTHTYDYDGKTYTFVPVGNVIPLLLMIFIYFIIRVRRRKMDITNYKI